MITNLFSFESIFKKACLGIFLAFASVAPVRAERIQITSFGHSALLVKGDGHSILLNPFKPVGCAEGLKEPNYQADIILASSELPDEGNRDVKGIFMVQPGSYNVGDLAIEGFSSPHDRLGGRRYGFSTGWQWVQGGLNFVHLGGSASPLKLEDKLLIGRPDVLVIAVGGGSKVYNGKEAAEVVRFLNPKIVIPVQYLRDKPKSSCDQSGIQPFLDEMVGIQLKDVGKSFILKSSKINDKTTIHLMP